MYVVDMYRGVVQAGGIWSAYLTDYIKAHDMELPVGKGRIWRVVYGSAAARRPAAPALSKATSRQLVQTLSNPKGWWRDTAQRLLVERGDATVAPALKTLAASAPDWRTRLHALWTLDGLDAIDVGVGSEGARATPTPTSVRPAVRLSERWLGQDAALRAAVLALVGRQELERAAAGGRVDRRDACRGSRRSGDRRCSPATARTRSSSMRRSAA